MSFLTLLGAALVVLAIILFVVRRSRQARLLEIMSTETETARSLEEAARYVAERMGEPGSFNRLVEVKGSARCDEPLTSEVAQQRCVHYSMEVEQEYEESYWETNPQTKEQERKTRRQTRVVASNSRRVPFWVEDSTGRVLIQPDGAEVEGEKVVERYQPGESHGSTGTLDLGGFSLDLGGLLGGLSGSRILGYRIREWAVPVDRAVYVLGEACDAAGKVSIRKPAEKGKEFLISVKSEEELIRATRSTLQKLMLGAIASGALGAVLIVAGLVRG